jgi:hypothetical protein
MQAGGQRVLVRAYSPATDATLHADLVSRPAGAPEVVLGSIDATSPPDSGFHLSTWIDSTVCVDALPGQTGDGLEVRLHYLSGSANISTIETALTIP